MFQKFHEVFFRLYTHSFNIFYTSYFTFHSFMHTAAPICRPTCLVCLFKSFYTIYISKYFAGWMTMQVVLCIVHCNKVSKPVKGKYLLLCMNSIIYLLLTWYTLIMFLKVLSHLILKIKSFMKYLKKGSWNIPKFSWNF